MGRWLLLAVMCPGCAWLLDFDELKRTQTTPSQDAGADAVPETALPDSSAPEPSASPRPESPAPESPAPEPRDGGPEQAGTETEPEDTASQPRDAAAEPPSLPTDCDPACEDSDPCTQSECVAGNCVVTARPALVDDGLDLSFEAEQLHESELIAVGDRFFVATYGVWDAVSDVLLQSFGLEGTDLANELRVSATLPEGFVAASPAAWVSNDSGESSHLHLYVALRDLLGPEDAPGELVRLQLNRSLELGGGGLAFVTSSPNVALRAGSPGPAAGRLPDGLPFVTWQGCALDTSADPPRCSLDASQAAGLFFQSGDNAVDPLDPGDQFVAEAGAIEQLLAITAGDTAGAVWLTDSPEAGAVVRLGLAGAPSFALTQCDVRPEYTGYDLDLAPQENGAWTLAWSERTGSKFVFEQHDLSCQDNTCSQGPDTEVCSGSNAPEVAEQVRSSVTRGVPLSNAATWPRLELQLRLSSTNTEAALHVLVNQIERGANDETQRTRLVTSQIATSSLGRTPVSTALAVTESHKVAVAWIEPADEQQPETLRLRRYRLCGLDTPP